MHPPDISGLSVVGWLIGEHDYQFNKFDAMYGDELKNRRDFIYSSEIQNKWHRNTVLRKGEAYAQANQQVLKVCAAARAVLVYDACLDGGDRGVTSGQTFHKMFSHLAKIDESNLPKNDVLFGTFENAFPDQTPNNLFLRAGELAMRAILSEQERTGRFVIPQPGLPSGNL